MQILKTNNVNKNCVSHRPASKTFTNLRTAFIEPADDGKKVVKKGIFGQRSLNPQTIMHTFLVRCSMQHAVMQPICRKHCNTARLGAWPRWFPKSPPTESRF
jgi:hypothetical protein